MKFTADLEIFGKVVDVECHASNICIYKITRGNDDLSDLLNIAHVEEELHRQYIDHKENLKAGV